MSAVQVAPSGERSQGRGRYGVSLVCRPQGQPCVIHTCRLALKFHERRYTSTLYLYLSTVREQLIWVRFLRRYIRVTGGVRRQISSLKVVSCYLQWVKEARLNPQKPLNSLRSYMGIARDVEILFSDCSSYIGPQI